jgi:hypothetical protein
MQKLAHILRRCRREVLPLDDALAQVHDGRRHQLHQRRQDDEHRPHDGLGKSGTQVWGPPDFLTTKAGDSFSYSCSYKNTLSQTLTFGETAAHNEMCLAIGYYFPDTITASCL